MSFSGLNVIAIFDGKHSERLREPIRNCYRSSGTKSFDEPTLSWSEFRGENISFRLPIEFITTANYPTASPIRFGFMFNEAGV